MSTEAQMIDGKIQLRVSKIEHSLYDSQKHLNKILSTSSMTVRTQLGFGEYQKY